MSHSVYSVGASIVGLFGMLYTITRVLISILIATKGNSLLATEKEFGIRIYSLCVLIAGRSVISSKNFKEYLVSASGDILIYLGYFLTIYSFGVSVYTLVCTIIVLTFQEIVLYFGKRVHTPAKLEIHITRMLFIFVIAEMVYQFSK